MLIKNLFDKTISLVLIILLTPFFLIVSLLIKLDSEGTVFFIQERVGKNSELFNIYKYLVFKCDWE